MLNFKNIPIIFDENPIARAYINLLLTNNLLDNEIIYLNSNIFLPNKMKAFLNFHKKNFYPLKLLKKKEINDLLIQIENFFDLEKNFIKKMYDFDNIYKFKSISFINDQSINSNSLIEKIKTHSEEIFLISGKQILRKILNINKKFIHIHPAYLPEIRGADGSLHSISKYGNLGSTAFFVNEGIDMGEIIFREKYKYKKFKLENLGNFNLKDLYRIWFSFVDPLIRIKNLEKLINHKYDNKTVNLENNNEENKQTNYFTFMNNNQLEGVFKKIFY